MDNNIFYITLQTGEKAIAVNNNDGNIYFNSQNQIKLKSLEMASVGLETWKSDILDEHFERDEVKEIFSWIKMAVLCSNPQSPATSPTQDSNTTSSTIVQTGDHAVNINNMGGNITINQ